MHLNEVCQNRDGRIVHLLFRSLLGILMRYSMFEVSFGNLDAIQHVRRTPLISTLNLPGSGFNKLLLDEGGNLLQFLVHLLEARDKSGLPLRHAPDLWNLIALVFSSQYLTKVIRFVFAR